MTTRDLTAGERAFLESLAAALPPSESTRLRTLLDRVVAEKACVGDDGSLITLFVREVQMLRPAREVLYSLEGRVPDADGAMCDVLLFHDGAGVPTTLEIVRYENGPLIAPNWTVAVVVTPPPLN